MGESDDENFVTFGSALDPLDEENLPRKKPVTIEDQYALDPQGRRRFHGAFTGGFSAGYFNSVGTRDGWRPQQFKSSRSSKADGLSQRPEDFMDDEDTSEFGIAPTAIRANSDFTDHGRRGAKRERQRQDNDGPIPGVPVLKELLKPVKDTVGVSLLKRMGWRPGQGIGPRLTKREKVTTRQKNDKLKIYGCSLPNRREKIESSDSEISDDNSEEILFAPDDYEPFICNPKDNYFGIGYTGLDRRPVLTSHVNLFEEPTEFKIRDKNKKLSIRGQAFGVGAFEADDEDIYQRDDMSRYDFALGPESSANKSRWSTPSEAESSKNKCLEGFTPATEKLERKKIFEGPELPKDFKPFHAIRKSRFYPPIEPIDQSESGRKKGLARHDLSARDRARILDDPPPGGQNLQLIRKDYPESVDTEKSNVACKIIERTLNLHGREQVEERALQDAQRASSSATWLEKLSYKSFVKGGVEGSDPSAAGSLKNLRDFRSDIADNQFARPFVSDPDKQKRFEKFVEFGNKGEREKLESLQPLSMTEWEREHERDEFEQAARLFERSSEETSRNNLESSSRDSTMSGKFVGSGTEAAAPSPARTLDEQMKNAAKMKLFGKLTREREIWQPASIVCKRFNIPEPRTGCAKTADRARTKKFSVFDSLDFGGVSERFEGATDTAGTFKEPEIPYVVRENTRNESGTPILSRGLDVSDIEATSGKTTVKMRSFEASYEKIFGRGAPITTSTSNAMSNVDEMNERVERENLNMENKEGLGPSSSITMDNSAEKKDLFKAIFLSSSEDSDSEAGDDEEDDSEVVKSLLIGKSAGDLNLQRNTSPPRGIFAKLDLDSLTKPGKIAKDEKTSKEGEDVNEDEKMAMNIDEEVNVRVSAIPEVEILPDMYGPVLPPKNISSGNESAPSSKDSELQRPIFKSIVVPKIKDGSTERSKGKWVERSKVKKSKKSKHKHKHKEKERSRHKHKSKKDKR